MKKKRVEGGLSPPGLLRKKRVEGGLESPGPTLSLFLLKYKEVQFLFSFYSKKRTFCFEGNDVLRIEN